MSQSDADPSVQNGIPYKWDGARNPNIPPYPLNNGVGSSQSSRDSSPIPKFSNVPLSQLPPNRNQIPSSQLPPSSSRSMFSPISTPQGLKSASVITNTPQSSPNIQNFGTSTPIIPKTQVTSAGNTFTGNNLFVNVSLTSSGSVPQSPHNPNETNRISPVQLNGSQSLSNPITTENLRQNLNQPVMSSSQLPQERHPPVKNLLISQQEVSQPMFMPVSAQMHFSEASSTSHTPRVPHPATVQESQKSVSVQSHFMNTPQVRPTLQPTMQPSQKVPVSGSLPQGQPQETLQPNLPTSSQNQATNPTMIQQQKAPVSLQAHFTSSPQVQLSQPVQNVPVSGQSQLEGQLQAVLQPSVPISNQNQPNSSGQSSVSSSQSQQKMPVVAPIPFSALKTFLPTSSQEKTDHQSAFATVGSQKQFSQSLGNLPGSQNVGNPTVQYGNPSMNQNMKMNQQSFSSQNIRQPNVTEQSFNQNARLQNPNSQNYTNPLLMGVSNHNTAFLNNQMMNAPRLSQPASVNPPVSQYMGMTNQFSPASNQAVNNQYGKTVTHQQAPVTSNQQLTSQPTSYQSVPQTNSQQFHKGLINQNPSGYLPSSQNQQIAPPMMQQFGAPPVSQSLTKQSGFPPTSQVMGPPPTSQNVTPFSTNQVMTPPPTSQTMKPPTNQTMAPPPSQTMVHPSTSQSMVPPPTSQTMAPPPVNQTMAMPSPKSQTMMPPPTGQTMVPPPTNQTVGSLTNNQSMNNQLGQSQSYQSRGNQLGPPPVSQNTGSQQFGPPPTSQNAGLYNQKYNKNIVNQNVQSVVNQNRGVSSGDMNRPPTYNNTMASQDNVPQYATTPTSPIYAKRYPQQNYQTSTPSTYSQPYRQATPTQGYQQSYPQNYQQSLSQGMTNMSLGQTGYNKIWSAENFDLLQCPNILPPEKMETPRVCLGQDFLNAANCSPDIFRCTMTKIPETGSLLQKSRLPLGVLIHPFKDLNHLPVIQCSTIVRCRTCRTYINPFVFFVDTKRWKCNLCYRVNELPEEFQYDPVSKSYGDPSRRPEIKASTIEYIAPSEYMLRPPQPAVYLFLLDISRLAIESGYLHTICDVLTAQLSTLPGDSRTQIGFLAYNSTLHFFSLGEGLSQPHEMTVLDIDDVFLPCPDNLLVNLKERMDLVTDLLTLLPTRYINSYDNGSALGAALQAAFKMMSATGGRVTVFQATLPTLGPGALTIREDPNQRAGKEAPHLNPATDFYKRLALECSGHQVAVDLFLMNSQYVDIATLSGISRFSGGCMHHFPLFKASSAVHAESLERCFRRYLTRKIGFEAVMRIRCTRGLSVHTFHGNFFVRSTDLLSLPNVNPDAGFGMQVSIDESLTDLQTVCFQAALLYTSSKGERRIRVHTLCLPVVNTLQDVLNSADQQCIVGILAKMAVDRSLQSSLSDARDAFINVAIDILHSYKVSLNMGESVSGLLASHSLKLLPLYILALLKHVAFRSGQSTRLDDRVFAMCEMKTLPLAQLVQQVYPDLYPIHNLSDEGGFVDPDGIVIPQPPRLQLTSRNVDAFGVYLLDAGQQMIIFVCQNAAPSFLSHVLGVPSYSAISDQFYELPKIENPDNQRLHTFIGSLNDDKPYSASLQIMRENSPHRTLFLERLIEDRIESALSYNEFLQHIKTQVK